MEPITIIGSGIGGLTAALALQQKGLKVSVFESAPEMKPVGSGIIMAGNAMQIFQRLGIRQQVERAGHKISLVKITDERLKAIAVVDLSGFEAQYGVSNVALHRADLQNILSGAVGEGNIKLAKKLVKIEAGEDFKLTFEDHTLLESKIVIAADGIHSTIRNQLFKPSKIRNARQICWRGVLETSLAEKYAHTAIEMWGKGKRFGFVKTSQHKLYWFAVINEGLHKGRGLTNLFREFHPDILEMIHQTAPENIFKSRLADLKPIPTWHRGNLCLLGDAAHATTPNLGQGACQAVEDAYALAKSLKTGKTIDEAFADYEKTRIRKARYIVNTSFRMGKMLHIENSFITWLRNHLMRIFSKLVASKQLNRVLSIEYLEER